jgi:hypothetical protein
MSALELRFTDSIPGYWMSSPAHADELCRCFFGDLYRMARFHDASQWGIFAYSESNWGTNVGSRAWTLIADQNANCWGSGEVAVPPTSALLECGPVPSVSSSPTPSRSSSPTPSRSPSFSPSRPATSFSCSGEYPHKHSTQIKCCKCTVGYVWMSDGDYCYDAINDFMALPICVNPSPSPSPTRSTSPTPTVTPSRTPSKSQLIIHEPSPDPPPVASICCLPAHVVGLYCITCPDSHPYLTNSLPITCTNCAMRRLEEDRHL